MFHALKIGTAPGWLSSTTVGLLLATVSPCPAQEFRALWVDAFNPGIKSAVEVRELMATVRATGFNAVLVEVRRRGDAYYQSQYEPKAADLGPEFDPLAEVISQAHQGTPRVEVHAWIVTYPVWSQSTAKPASADHVFNRHPDWLSKNIRGQRWDGHNYQLDPGHPAVQTHLANVALDLVTRYDLDGLHLDYIRYPGTAWGYNATSLRRFKSLHNRTRLPQPEDPLWRQFRRDQVTALVRKIYLSALALKPQLKLSAATIAWAPGITQDDEWSTTSAYADVLQDWRAWLAEGILDLNIPMLYFRQGANGGDWDRWSEFVKDHQYERHAVLGAGLYLNHAADSLGQLRSTRQPSTNGRSARGFAAYSYAFTATDVTRADFWSALTNARPGVIGPFLLPDQPNVVPEMVWKTAPKFGHLRGTVMQQATGAPLDGTTVDLSGPVNRTLRTDGTGFYGAVDLPPGSYSLAIHSTGFSATNTLVAIELGLVATHDFTLPSAEPERPAARRPVP